ncbi:MAG: bifunctional UDP-N-acetylglucosamine diphosphorylase/glucosamine-1-phosphate N-acetyltransferase GlmU [Holosporaceae bacterium]|nr:bifunctional UDP-N-acetylglucosamine diphosphorylase/glucosamine-1-phosphate N-acetyltransferase GlmU [Holosporaceae bacterium]
MGSSVVILAAGIGSRLKSNLPKVFHRIGGVSLLDHVIKSAKEITPNEIVVILNPQHAEHAQREFDANIRIAYQKTPLGTADAVKAGLLSLAASNDGWVYILYGDIPLVSPVALRKLMETAHLCEKTAIVVLAMDSVGTAGLGRLEAAKESGTIKAIVEVSDVSDGRTFLPLCNAGLLIRKDVLKQLIDGIKPNQSTGEFYITEMVRLAYLAGYVCRYYRGDARELAGVNTRSELAALERIFQEREREKHIGNGVTLIAPETVFFSHDTHIENDVVVHPYVVFLGGVRVKSGAEINSFCTLEGTTVGGARVGPFARLRAGTEIHDEVQIGNFVEVKNSLLGKKTKINHLSYIGDACIGCVVNIGAGTITCNYDGKAKHRTIIGNRVFVGSNTALVAPVEIGDDATVGAGSIIVEDVESGALAIARANQKNVADWSNRKKK